MEAEQGELQAENETLINPKAALAQAFSVTLGAGHHHRSSGFSCFLSLATTRLLMGKDFFQAYMCWDSL